MDSFIADVNTAAMILGYPLLFVITCLLCWFGTRIFRDLSKIFNEMRYERWRRRNAERDWDRIDASWDAPPPIEQTWSANWEDDTDVFPVIPDQRLTQTELPQLYNIQEDRHEHW